MYRKNKTSRNNSERCTAKKKNKTNNINKKKHQHCSKSIKPKKGWREIV
jgi:hypothetical protein